MGRKSKKIQEPDAPSVPAYIVTFSDMVTLLLTFFVMLLSMAQMQDPELFNKSRDAFNENINCYGLGLLFGTQPVPEFGQKKVKYFIPDPDKKEVARTVDSKEEALRRLFQKAAESMEVMPSGIEVRLSDYSPMRVHFAKGQTELDDSDRQYLKQFAIEYQQRSQTEQIALYVLGLAPDESGPKQQWIVSSWRAQQVADYLAEAGFKCPIYSWGSGAGDAWVEKDSPIYKDSQILIALIRPDGSKIHLASTL